jgi:hypothetical protein
VRPTEVREKKWLTQSQGVPFVFPHFTYLGLGSDYENDKHVSVPSADSLLPGNAVVEFESAKK